MERSPDADLAKHLAEAVRAARADNRSLYLRGGDSKRVRYGRRCDAADLDVSGHRGIVSYRPAEMVITARSGTPISELVAAVDEAGQRLAFDAPTCGGRATLGGSLACNASGPARPWLGSVRDAVLGLRLVDGGGQLLRFGGEVIKNVAGYDVSRLQAGALGTLGLITEVSLRLLPKPETRLCLTRSCELDAAIPCLREVALEALPLSGACWYDGALRLRFEGSSAAMRALRARFADWAPDDDGFWTRLREGALPGLERPHIRADLAAATAAAALADTWLIDWAGSLRLLPEPVDDLPLAEHAASTRAQVQLCGYGDQEREVFPAPKPAMRHVLQRTKQAADPGAVFNPGRLYEWM
ncbi:MAG: glycolate oxidase subunit GlcE [Halieaceae bacterium]|nr:glycolate oxidase subunit GlcE [Halieaceae bacterium]